MQIQVKFTPKTRELQIALGKLDKTTKRAVKKALFDISKDLIDTSVKHINAKPKHGRTYKVKINGTWVNHVASAPGEPPANMRGNLKKTVHAVVKGSETLFFNAGSASVPYASILEFGGYSGRNHKSLIKKRPYLYRSITENAQNIARRIRERIESETK